jgi:hypothetical protein
MPDIGPNIGAMENLERGKTTMASKSALLYRVSEHDTARRKYENK